MGGRHPERSQEAGATGAEISTRVSTKLAGTGVSGQTEESQVPTEPERWPGGQPVPDETPRQLLTGATMCPGRHPISQEAPCRPVSQ